MGIVPTSSLVAADARPAGPPATPVGAGSLLKALRAQEAHKADLAPHLIVQAYAGTGKTTTLVGGLQALKGMTPTTASGKPIDPSPQQRAVWDAICLSPPESSVCFVAFNRSIADELKRRVPPGCSAMTLHGLGVRTINRCLGRLELDDDVVRDLILDELGIGRRPVQVVTNPTPEEVALHKRLQRLWFDRVAEKKTVINAVDELVGLCKQNLVLVPQAGELPSVRGWDWEDGQAKELDHLSSHYGVDLNGSREEVFRLVPIILDKCRRPRDRINYDDMIWLPVVLGLPIQKWDLGMVDEGQDLNRCQQALVKMAFRRIVLCGDPNQAIYGFAGADSESMSRMEKELSDPVVVNVDGEPQKPGACGRNVGRGCVVLPLTVTRRCGKAIVEMARKYVPDFEAHESCPDGEVTSLPFERGGKSPYHDVVAPGDFVLCRANAPLASECFRLLKRGIPASIAGRKDAIKGLVRLIERLDPTKKKHAPDANVMALLIANLEAWHVREREKEEARERPSAVRLHALADRVECIHAFVKADGVETVADVITKIQETFTDAENTPGVRLSSIHKAKGLEARRVFFLDGFGPPVWKLKEWERKQETNLRYVCFTRAIEFLCIVEGEEERS